MTMPTIPEAGPHTAALVEHVRANGHPNLRVEYGIGPPEPARPPYVVVYPDAGEVESSRLCDSNTDISVLATIRAVGQYPEQCAWAVDKFRSAILGNPAPFSVPGRKLFPVRQTLGPGHMRRDDSLQPAVYILVAQFEMWSQPSPG